MTTATMQAQIYCVKCKAKTDNAAGSVEKVTMKNGRGATPSQVRRLRHQEVSNRRVAVTPGAVRHTPKPYGAASPGGPVPCCQPATQRSRAAPDASKRPNPRHAAKQHPPQESTFPRQSHGEAPQTQKTDLRHARSQKRPQNSGTLCNH